MTIHLGGCQCEEIRYEIRGKPLIFYACQCRECQKQSGSAFGLSLTVPRSSLQIIQGEVKNWTRESGNDRSVTCLFCPNCGTRLFHDRSYNRETINIKAGTLDDPSWLKPVGNIWTKSAQPWVIISDKLINEAEQPKSVDLLWKKWAEQSKQ